MDVATAWSAAVERHPDMERALGLVQRAAVTDEELASVLPLYERAARQTGNDRQLLDALTRRAQTAAATPAAIREGYDLATALNAQGNRAEQPLPGRHE